MKIVEEPPAIYEDPEISDKIPVKYTSLISDTALQSNLIYESYKARSLSEMVNYMDFCLSFRSIVPNNVCSFSYSAGPEESKCGPLAQHPFKSSNMPKELKEYYNSEIQTSFPQEVDQSKILVFDSNFECGNLDKVTIVALDEYNLFLNPDTNTRGYSQWFYFAVGNTRENTKVTFHILNCTNPAGLFKKGMKPLVFSEAEYKDKGTQWTPDTANVTYTPNDLAKKLTSNPNSSRTYYTLSFSYCFKHSSDRVYFAYTRPYTVGMLLALLKGVKAQLGESAEQVKGLEEGLQKRIRKFSAEAIEAEQKREEKKAKKVGAKTPNSEEVVVRAHNWKYEWMKSEDVLIEAKGIYYKQETLCRSFSGIPIVLLTITKYVLPIFR